MATVADYEKMAFICEDRKKPSCVETSYAKIAFLQPKNLENLERLAKIQFQQQDWTRAGLTLTRYFTLKGKSIDAGYMFAQILQKQKKYSESDRYYRFALSKKSKTMQISMTRSYIQMLIEANRLTQAKNVLLHYRSKSSTASLFMNKELKEIRQRLGEIRRTAAY